MFILNTFVLFLLYFRFGCHGNISNSLRQFSCSFSSLSNQFFLKFMEGTSAAAPTDEAIRENDDPGPGRLYEIFQQNELVIERLKLLNYEKEFVGLDDSLKTVPRHYFVQSTNVGEQFHLFTSLCAWLIRNAQIGQMEMPHEFDDPNATIAQILDALRGKGIDVNFPPNKLKSGSGQQCIFVLLKLTELALEQNGFKYGVIQAGEEEPEGGNNEELNEVDQAELTAEQFEEEVELAEDEDEPMGEANDERMMGGELESGVHDLEIKESLKGVMRNNAHNYEQMQEELKRVIPQLKITVRANLKDWRMHAEQMAKLEAALVEQYAEVKPFLSRNADEVEKAMERIATREQHLNDQFGGLLQLYRTKQNELAAISEQYKESSGTLNSRTETLNALNEEIDQIKQQIEEQGTQNTSGAPILKIKQALTKIDKDCFVMRVQITTLEQALMQTQLADHFNNALDYLNVNYSANFI